MACTAPVQAWVYADGLVRFSEKKGAERPILLPCGGCLSCRVSKSREWAVRCMHEASMHESNSFITLTYDNEFLPVDGSLNYRDWQLFAKRLRKSMPFRFFMVGEYGEKTWRPHYHALLFGVDFPDKVYHSKSPTGHALWVSEFLDSCWGKGFCNIGAVTYESAGYLTRYSLKKVTGDKAWEHYRRFDPENGEVWWLRPEFAQMSRKPGIGATWLEKYGATDVFPHDRVVIDGKELPVPRYYDKQLEKLDVARLEENKYQREVKAERFLEHTYPDRLAVRDTVLKAKMSLKKRTLE